MFVVYSLISFSCRLIFYALAGCERVWNIAVVGGGGMAQGATTDQSFLNIIRFSGNFGKTQGWSAPSPEGRTHREF